MGRRARGVRARVVGVGIAAVACAALAVAIGGGSGTAPDAEAIQAERANGSTAAPRVARRAPIVARMIRPTRGDLRRGRVRLAITARRPARVRVQTRIRSRIGGRLSERVGARTRMLTFRRPARRIVPVRLNRVSRSRLERCGSHRIRALVTGLRPRGAGPAARRAFGTRGRRVNRSRLVRITDCDPRRGPPAPLGAIDAANADRCDPIVGARCMLPFPNDHFTRPDPASPTGLRVHFDRRSMPRNRLGLPIQPADYNRSDGFGPGQKIVVKVPGLESQEAFDRTGAVPVTDMARHEDPDQPVVIINARTGERHMVFAEVDSNPASDADRNLIIRPGVNFDHGERYVVALRSLRRADGTEIAPPEEFRAYRDGLDTGIPEMETRRPSMDRLLNDLERAGIERHDLYLAWDFTVASAESVTGRMLSIRDRAFAELGDTNLSNLTVEGRPPPFLITRQASHGNPGTFRIVEGILLAPCYLSLPGCVPGSRFQFPGDSTVPYRIPGNVAPVNFTCTIPESAIAQGPGSSRPSLYGHGLFGGQGEIEADNVQAMGSEHNFTFCATDWAGMSTLDIPYVALILQDLSLFPGLADRVQQGILNFLLLGRAMIHPDGLPSHPAFQHGGQSVIDTRRLFYDGNSQGGIIGGALMAVSPDAERGVLGVPGMNYSLLLRRSVDFDAYAEGFGTPLGLYGNYPDELERPLVLSMVQMLWDRAEANGYAHHMTARPLPNTPPHEVMLHVAFGDHQVADLAAEIEARTIGARAYTPVLDEGRHFAVEPLLGIPRIPSYPATGSAIVYWDSGSPTSPPGNIAPREGRDPHGDPRSDPKARIQKSEFLRIDGRVVEACAGGPCYARDYAGNGRPPVP